MKAMLKARHLSQGELARRVGITQGTIYKLVAGHAKSSKKIVEIAQALGVRAEWLLTGEGDQYVAGFKNLNHNSNRHELGSDPESLEVYERASPLIGGEIDIPLLVDLESAFEISPFPFNTYNGPTMRIEKKDLMSFGVDESGSDLIAISVTGDSMDPVLPEGSKIGINLSEKRIIDGKMYAVDQSGWIRLRMLYRSGPNEITLKSYNVDNYPEEKLPMDQIEVLGRVFFSQRAM